jgi:ABC-type transport system substrate-binding protein
VTLAKVRRFSLPGLPQAGLDRLTVRYGDRRAAATDAYADPPVRRRDRDGGYQERAAMATYYFFLNHRVPPFDNVDVRRAAASALDRYPLARRFGMAPACDILPPGMPGHAPRGPCPFLPEGTPPDLEQPRAAVRAAGAEGMRVRVYGNSERASRRQAQAFAATLRSIGLDARARIVPGDVYFTVIGSQRTRAQAGVTNWFADYPHPHNFLFQFSGDTIQRTNNQNFGNVDDSGLTNTIARVFEQPPEVAAEEATSANYRIIDEAHAIPWGYAPHGARYSARVPPECRVLHPLYGADLARLCVR